jgi:hypothetical protein
MTRQGAWPFGLVEAVWAGVAVALGCQAVPQNAALIEILSGGDGLTVLLQARGKASQRAVLMRGAALDEDGIDPRQR